MRVRRALSVAPGLIVRAAAGLVVLVLSVVLLTETGLATEAPAPAADTTSLDQTKAALDEIEETLGREDVSAETLANLRQKLNAAIDALRGFVEELEPRVGEAEERLKQLGPAPAKDAPPEFFRDRQRARGAQQTIQRS